MMTENIKNWVKKWPAVNFAQLRILQVIGHSNEMHDQVCISEIAHLLDMPHRHVSHHVSVMATGRTNRPNTGFGLLSVKTNTDDQRYRDLALTEDGHELLTAIVNHNHGLYKLYSAIPTFTGAAS